MRIPGALALVFAICGAAQAAPPDAPAPSGSRPNILFIFSDDHAYQAIGAYGSQINKTPQMDRLAAEGMLFRECYVSNSICGPQRACILTGKYSHRNGFVRNGNQFDGAQWTFPKALQTAGYQTALIGKWHLGEHEPPQGFDRSEVLIGQGDYYNPTMLRDDGDPVTPRKRVRHTGYTTDVIADLGLQWLREERDPQRPFLLMLQHKAVHRHWDPAARHLGLYDGETIPEPDTLFEDRSGAIAPRRTQEMNIAEQISPRDLKLIAPPELNPEQRAAWDAAYGPRNAAFRDAALSGRALTRWKYQRYIKDYLRCVAALDESIGRVLDALDAAGLADDTIVVYSSDQGFFLGEHGWFDKRWIYEQSLRAPLIVRWPGVAAPGSATGAIVSPMDFAATFLEAAGAPIPTDLDGRSMLPLLAGRTPADWRRDIYYHYYEYPGWHLVRRHYGIVAPPHKLVHFYEKDVNQWELLDLEADPKEQQNFYDDPAYADIRATLHARLADLRAQLGVGDQDPPQSHQRGDTPDKYRDKL